MRDSGGFSTVSSTSPGNEGCWVPAVSLESLLSEVRSPYLLKVDCEGCEADLVSREPHAVEAFKYIILKSHPHVTGIPHERLISSIEGLGFTCRRLGVTVSDATTFYCTKR
ncbi:hypothetical protein ASAC_0656 [Acidilobus saccharovorans 345-15]|uniref:Methyltransferase FkbM domain-containing protein n=1 Tax=Acidilobus saccharovorans (strain DSM 16705 / JCM 18335 / VKM B-2471 / 345-15) TaxID=666510 RepID=D9Q174_ACIS3|nr:hypothetical protein ASAC_0656 [Acidilobus saccharovorans 345-15]